MKYNINLGSWGSVFAVPSAVVDKYILLASGQAIKVLLFLLKNNDKSFSVGDIALQLKITEETVSDAISFWVQAGLLCENSGELTPVSTKENESSLSFVAEVSENKTVNVRKVEKKTETALSPSEIAERIEGSAEIKFLFDEAQKLFGRPLNYTEQRGLIHITDYLGLNTDIILMIIRYCKSQDSCTMKKIDAIASAWEKEGIKTHTEAEKKLAFMKKQSKLHSRVKSAFGIDRNLSSKEKAYIEKWSLEYKMSFDMIEAAYQIMCDNGITKTSFAYVDKILENWNVDGVHSTDKIEKKKKTTAKPETKTASYDLAEFEKQLFGTTSKGTNND